MELGVRKRGEPDALINRLSTIAVAAAIPLETSAERPADTIREPDDPSARTPDW